MGATQQLLASYGSSFVGPLDNYTAGLVVCWSVSRKLLSSYTGAACLVRADRSGQPTFNVPFNADGTLNTSALLAFAGSDSVYVVTAYAQFGSYDFTEPTAYTQPRIVNAGVLEVGGAYWDGLGLGKDLANGDIVFPSTTTRQSITKLILNGGEGGGMWELLGSASATGDYVNAFGAVYMDLPEGGARVVAPLLSTGSNQVLSEERNGTSAIVRVNGSITASRNDASGDMSISGYLGVGRRSGYAFSGRIQDFCQWSDTTNAAGRAAALQ